MALAELDEPAPADDPASDPADDTAPATSADVYVFDDIGGWFGLTADDFVRDVAGLDVDQIVLHLNTPGGDALEGVAIANVLRAHKAKVVVRVDGIAASAGSVVAMAGDEVIMGIGSEMMIHDPWGMAVGDAVAIENYGRRLGTTGNALASTYAAKAGGTTENWRELMKTETWYTAQEAVDAKLADRVATADEKGTAEGEQITPGGGMGSFWDMWDSLKRPDRFDLSMFNHAGRAHAPAPRMQPLKVRNAVDFTDEELAQMRTDLGLDDSATKEDILAAVAAKSADDEADPAPADDSPPAADPPAPTEGTVTVDSATLASLRAQAARGEEARTRQEAEDREALVSAAVRDGRIPPARKDHWIKALAADPGAAASLAGLEPGLIPVGEPVGVGADAADDPLYVSLFGKEGS
jgi:ATP-dependent protease ClpP protease subunit